MNRHRILIADDEQKMCRILQIILRGKGYEIDLCHNGNEAWNMFREARYDLVITDLKMPGMDGMELLGLIQKQNPDLPVIVITAYGSIDSAVKAMKRGAYDYITKPFENEVIKLVVSKALTFSSLKDENRYLREAVESNYAFDHFIGNSHQIREMRELAAQVAQTSSTVLIRGESGTGKELIARLIHFNSPRAGRPFVAFNCGALPDNLLESELFGYEKGAFTGAHKRKPGRFDMAHTGTIFLDEVGDMSQELQVKMLRVMEERTFERLGGTETLQVDVRFIAASNRDLKILVREGSFREELYYRLNIFPISIPPLRERREDISLLVRHFLDKFAMEIGKQVKGVSPQAMNLLISQPWRGNVRELQNCLERAMILCKGKVIAPGDLILDHDRTTHNLAHPSISIPSEGICLEEVERSLIMKAISMARGNQTRAATLLKITRNTLRYRMEKYGIDPGA